MIRVVGGGWRTLHYSWMSMPRAHFFYGVSAGCGAGWLLFTLLRDRAIAWVLLGSAVALALALGFHHAHRRESLGRRWRRTTSPFGKF
jgi:hypothetical protein